MKLLYDLGAHWGESIKAFRKKLENPKEWDVISVEASTLNVDKLAENASYEANYFNEITIFNAFVYHEEKEIEFFEYIDEFHSAGSTYSKTKFDLNSKKKPEYENLPHNVLKPDIFNIVDSYKENLDKYDEIIIKMDIEGAEYDILPSLMKVLDPNKTKQFYCELHSRNVGLSPEVDKKIMSELKELGIQVNIEGIDYIPYVKTTR